MPLSEKIKKRNKLAEFFSNEPTSPYYKPGSFTVPKQEEKVDLLASPTGKSYGTSSGESIPPIDKYRKNFANQTTDEDEESKNKKKARAKKPGLAEKETA